MPYISHNSYDLFSYSCCRLDGFIVCEEHQDTLLAAWDEDQEIQRQREAEVSHVTGSSESCDRLR